MTLRTGRRVAIVALLAVALAGCSASGSGSSSEGDSWDPGIAGIEGPGSDIYAEVAPQIEAIKNAMTAAGFSPGGLVAVDVETDPVVFVGYSGRDCLIGKLGYWVAEDVYIFHIPELDPEQFVDPTTAMGSLGC